MSSAPKKRPLLAVLGAIPLLAVVIGLALSNAETRSQLAVIRDCRKCGLVGKPVESGWVAVQPGDAWAVALEAHAGLVLRGPARFEVAGKDRIALSSGVAFLTSANGSRAVALLPRSETAGIEGATAASDGTARVAVIAGQEGNRVDALAGRAVLELASGERTLDAGATWQSGKADAAAPLAPDEALWLDSLAR